LACHGESAANLAGIFSSDPGHLVPLTSRGESQARQLGSQLANLNIDVAVGTAFARTQRTIELALEGRRVPILIDRDGE
jgi:broad specificity phosphatase PhoE